jgi:thiol:disulfide interchange protein DsbD
VICVLLIAADVGLIVETKPSPEAIVWNAWSPQAVEEAQKAGHPVLVDFTARTCLTCQVNKRTSIEIPSTRAKLKQTGTVALVGDFTREDPLIAKELQKFSGGGIPLVLVYSKETSKPPEILPTILSPSAVQDALTKAAE